MTLIEQAMVMLMSSSLAKKNEGQKLYLPFEYVKYLSQVWSVTKDQKQAFQTKLDQYFSENEEFDFSCNPITLEVHTDSQYLIETNPDVATYKA